MKAKLYIRKIGNTLILAQPYRLGSRVKLASGRVAMKGDTPEELRTAVSKGVSDLHTGIKSRQNPTGEPLGA